MFDAGRLKPQVTWGTSPEMVVSVDGVVPDPDKESDSVRREGIRNALKYMGLKAGTPISEIRPDHVFIGSCTNARIEDLRAAAGAIRGRKVADSIRQALVVPGSGLVKRAAEAEGLDVIFKAAGFEWREPGLFHVSCHERGPACTRAIAVPRRRTVISRVARDRAGGRILSAPRWRLRRQ